MLQSYDQRYNTLTSPVNVSFDDEKVANPTPQPISETPVQKVQGEPFVFLFCLFTLPAWHICFFLLHMERHSACIQFNLALIIQYRTGLSNSS